MSASQLEQAIEALLFTASEPLTAERLAELTTMPDEDVAAALASLKTRLIHGIRLAQLDGRYRLVTAPEASEIVARFLADSGRQELSRPALETLAIVAYRGPVTKSRIDAIRGVSSEAMLRNLLSRGLIEEAGRSTEPGRPQQYAVSHTFLQHFGLTSPAELPSLPDTTS